MKESKFDGFYVVKNWSFQNDSKIGFRDKFDGSKIKVMVYYVRISLRDIRMAKGQSFRSLTLLNK